MDVQHLARAVTLMLNCDTVSIDASTLASLLRTNTAVRAAAQQAHPCLDVEFSRVRDANRVASFADWLVENGHLVASLSITRVSNGCERVVETLLSLGMRLAGPRLQLRSFTSGFTIGSQMLGALPAATLTSLDLSGARALQAVSRLTSLQQVQLTSCCGQQEDLTTLQPLTRLTSLDFEYWSDHKPIDLSQMTTQLTRLTIRDVCGDMAPGSLLPPSLRHLTISCTKSAVSRYSITTLQQLQDLQLECCGQGGDLASLTALGHLTWLSVEFDGVSQVVAMEPAAMRSLSMLRALKLDSAGWAEEITPPERMLMEAVLVQATGLTSLSLSVMFEEPCALGSTLAALTSLRHLQVCCGQWDACTDALRLTSLTRLTLLQLYGCEVGGEAAVALACKLQQLQSLALDLCPWAGVVLLHIGRNLQQLRALRLTGSTCIAEAGSLLLLTQLSGLTELELTDAQGSKPSQQALDSFWEMLRSRPQH